MKKHTILGKHILTKKEAARLGVPKLSNVEVDYGTDTNNSKTFSYLYSDGNYLGYLYIEAHNDN